MKKLSWFVFGVLGGFVAAHFVNKNPNGAEALAELDARIGEFTDRIGEAYRAEEARLAPHAHVEATAIAESPSATPAAS